MAASFCGEQLELLPNFAYFGVKSIIRWGAMVIFWKSQRKNVELWQQKVIRYCFAFHFTEKKQQFYQQSLDLYIWKQLDNGEEQEDRLEEEMMRPGRLNLLNVMNCAHTQQYIATFQREKNYIWTNNSLKYNVQVQHTCPMTL